MQSTSLFLKTPQPAHKQPQHGASPLKSCTNRADAGNVPAGTSAAARARTSCSAASQAGRHLLQPDSSRRQVLHFLAATSSLAFWGPAQGAAAAAAAAVLDAADTAEAAAAACQGCVASISAIPSGKAAGLGEQQLGCGIVWGSQGHIVVPYAPLTRAQRLGTAGDPQVVARLTAADGSRHALPAVIVAKDAAHELVVLQVAPPAGGLQPPELASSAGLRVGQDAYLLATLPDGAPSLAAGIVSATGRTIPASNNQAIAGVLQTDVEVNSQTLGGALVNSSGQLIGMPVVSFVKPGSARSSGVNFALPSDLLREVVPRLIAYGSAAVWR